MALASEVQDDIPSSPHRGLAIVLAIAIVVTTAIGTTAWAPASPRTTQQDTDMHLAGTTNRPPVVAFPTSTQGYALAAPCANQDCHYRLWTTATSGESWRGHSTPLRVDAAQPQLGTFGSEGILVSSGNERWISDDRGRVWRHLPETPTATRNTLTSGSLTTTRCDDGRCDIHAIEPDGTFIKLETPPGLSEVDNTHWQRLYETTLVLSGADQQGHPVIATSHNAGQDWTVLELGGQLTEPHTLLAAGNAHGTLLVWTQALDESITSYRTDDEGGSWNTLGRSLSRPISIAALPSGRALVLEGVTLLSSEHDNTALTPVPNAPALRDFRHTGEILVGTGLAGEIFLSTDGLDWQLLDLTSLS